MAKRYEEVRKGTSKKLEGILSNKDEFVNFIRFYSRFYKYSFLDVLCVYVQNENATAVADYDTWKRINYQVRRGEKGIGLFDKTKFSKLRYVFDVSSTYQKTIDLWKYDENKHKHIVVINSNKEDFFDKHKFENIQDENAKLLAFYINRLGKRHRLNLESDDEKEINGLISDILKNKNFYEKNLILSDICLTIKSDLLEIENSIKQYNNSLLDVLCVYVQNENATAVADYDTWKRIKYQVRRGEKGIGLFDESTFSKLRYVFDVSSTYQQRISLWNYDQHKHKDIVNLEIDKNTFFENHNLNIENEHIKELYFYMNYIGKKNRLGIDFKIDEPIINIVKNGLKSINKYDIDLVLNDICLTIKSDLLEIENSIKQYNNSLNKQKKEEKEQKKSYKG